MMQHMLLRLWNTTFMYSTAGILVMASVALPSLAADTNRVLPPQKEYINPTALKSVEAPVHAAKQKPEDEPVEISLNTIVLFALSDNPDVQIALAQEKQALANVGKADAKFYPLVDFSAEAGAEHNFPAASAFGGGSHINPNRRVNISMRQLIYDWGLSKSVYNQQKQLKDSAKIQTRINEEGVLTDTIGFYLDILNYQQSLANTEVFVTRLRELNKIIKEMYEGGGTSKATLDYANSRLASAETEINNMRASLNDAMSNLEFLTGKLPVFKAVNPDDLDPMKLDIQQYIETAQAENSGLMRGRSDLKAMDHKLGAAEKAMYPTVSFVSSAEDKFNDGGEIGTVRNAEAVVQLNWRLFDGSERKEQINLIRGQREEMEIAQSKAIREILREIELSYNQINAVQESIRQTDKEVVSSEALQRTNRENFKYGSINIIELIEGEERLNAARTRTTRLRSDLYMNTYRILVMSGMLKKDYFCEGCVNPNI